MLYRCGGLGTVAGPAHAACGHGAAMLSGLDQPEKKRMKGAPPKRGYRLEERAWRPFRSMSPAARFKERGCATRGALGGKPPRLRVLPKCLQERQR